MSAAASPVRGLAGARLSIFTVSTGPSAATGSPVNGEVSADERDGPGREGVPRPGSTTTSATDSPVATATANAPLTTDRRDHLLAPNSWINMYRQDGHSRPTPPAV